MEAHVLKKFVAERFAGIFGEITEQYLPKSQFQDEEGMVTTVKPTVVIGIGGSGVKAVARLKLRVQNFYRGAEFESERKSLSFLLMDTLSYENIRKEDPDSARLIYQVISRDDYVYLGGFNPGQYLQSQRPMSQDIQRWWDERYAPPQVMIEEGAKRVRQLGRLALYRNKEQCRASIRNSINSVLTIHDSLVREGKARGLGEEAGNVNFYIFSGTCGGTGSGTLFDVVYLCYTLARDLGKIPKIHLVLFMPKLFIEAARRKSSGEWLAKAFEVNAYAFFKEIQHFVTEGEKLYTWRLDAKEREGSDNRPEEAWRPQRIYLFDTELAGREIGVGEFNQLYTLAADYIFQIMVTPAGFALESSRATDFDQTLGSRSGGRPNAFSSAGNSYIVYPSKTIARSLSCHLLREVLEYIRRSPLDEEEKKESLKKADELYLSLGDFLNPTKIDEKLLSGVDVYVKAIPSGDQVLQRMGGKEEIKASGLLQRAEETGEGQEGIGKTRVDQNLEGFKGEALRELGKGLEEAVKKFIPDGFEFINNLFSHMRKNAEEDNSKNRPASAVKAETEAREAIRQVQTLENKWFVWKKKQKTEDQVKKAATKIREEADLTIKGYAAEKRMAYLIEAIEVIEETVDRLKRIRNIFISLSDDMENRRKDTSCEYDETSVSVTTQFVPFAPQLKRFEELFKEAKLDVKEFSRNLFSSTNLKTASWLVGSAQESEVESSLQNLLREALSQCIEQIGRPWLEKKVTDVIMEKWKDNPEDFKETYGRNLLNLADPSWLLIRDQIPQSEFRVTALDPVSAYSKEGFPRDRYMPEDLRGEPFPGDPRMMVVLRSEHAAPLFAVQGVMSLKELYRQWLKRFQEYGEAPPHISRDWNRSEDALEDVEKRVIEGTEEQEAFAYGLFADWLVREKKEQRLLEILAKQEPTGPIYVKGARGNYFCVSYEKRDDGKLHQRGEKSLGTTKRYEAARAMDSKAKEDVTFFIERVVDTFSTVDLRTLVEEYKDYLTSKYSELLELNALEEREQEKKIKDMPDERQRSLYRQLLQEIKIFNRFKADLGGM